MASTPEQNLITRVRAAVRRVAPHAAFVIAAGVVVVTPQQAEGQTAREEAVLDQAANAGITFPRNISIPQPRATGHRPHHLLLNLTDNTIVWVDAEGRPTWAPKGYAALEDVPIAEIGSLDARYGNSRGLLRRALMAEPTRVLLSRNGQQNDLYTAILVRGAPGDPSGYPDFTAADLADAQQYVSEQAQYERQNRTRSAADEAASEAAGMPGRVVRDGVNQAQNEIEYQIRDKVNETIYRTVGKIFRRP